MDDAATTLPDSMFKIIKAKTEKDQLLTVDSLKDSATGRLADRG